MQPHAVTRDITDHIPGLNGPLQISAWIFAPHGQIEGVIFCPGSKTSYHLIVPAMPEDAYRFGLSMAERGWLVIAIDTLGTGESFHPEEILTIETLACANEVAYQHILARILDGSFDLPTISYPSVSVCVGHGRGALLAMAEQARYHRFDALALSGWSNSQFSLGGWEAALARVVVGREELLIEQIAQEIPPEHFSTAFCILQPFFFSVGVPASVVYAYEHHARDFIGSLTEYDYGKVQQIATLIDVPIFLCLASNDVADNLLNASSKKSRNSHRQERLATEPEGAVPSDNPASSSWKHIAEAATYPWSPQVSTFHLLGSAHLHNFATTRHLLWAQLDAWIQHVQEQILQCL